jgi:transketolase
MGSLKPLDVDFLGQVFSQSAVVATLEEHSILGGLGTAVAEWKVDRSEGAALIRFATPDEFLHETSHQSSARAWAGLTAERIAGRIREIL